MLHKLFNDFTIFRLKLLNLNPFKYFTKCEVYLNHFLSRSIFDKQDLVSVCNLQLIK